MISPFDVLFIELIGNKKPIFKLAPNDKTFITDSLEQVLQSTVREETEHLGTDSKYETLNSMDRSITHSALEWN